MHGNSNRTLMPEANQRDIDSIVNQYVFPFIWLINFNLEIHLGWGPMGIKKTEGSMEYNRAM